MAEYSISEYIQSKSTLKAKVLAMDSLIDAMELKILESVDGVGVNVDEYSMDDGQMKIRTKYRSIQDVSSGVDALQKLRNKYHNQLVGRCVVLRDVRSM